MTSLFTQHFFSHLQLLVEGVDNAPWVSRLQIMLSLLSVPESDSLSHFFLHVFGFCTYEFTL